MVGRKKRTKTCGKGSQEDWISKLPDALISDILAHLPTKDVVRTSVLSTRWRNLWQCVPELDLDSHAFSNLDAFVTFAERFRESLMIRKLRLSNHFPDSNSFLTSWIDVLTTHRIQHLDLHFDIINHRDASPLSIYTCETLVHLRLCQAVLPNAEFVSLPCLKIIHLEAIDYPNAATLEKLISGSPVLEDLTIIRLCDREKVIQVRSNTLQRIAINDSNKVVIDAPLLQCLRTIIYSTKNFDIINSGFFPKLDIDVGDFHRFVLTESFIRDILTDISRVRDLVITSVILKKIFLYSVSGQVLQFRDLSRLNAKFSKSHLKMLPTILESCPKLETLRLELVKHQSRKKNREPNVMFSTVPPPCLVSSLKYVELKRLIPKYEGEIELVRYFLKNSTILEKLKLATYYTKKVTRNFLKEVMAMPRCSSACQVLIL